MKNFLAALCVFSVFPFSSASASSKNPKDPAASVALVLDEWHLSAARHAEEPYFNAMTSDFVFLGTDPAERWTKEEFRAYAHPIFAAGKGWEMKSVKRKIFLSRDGKTAWFDEDVESKGLGSVRGSGVLVKEKAGWKMAQYNLSLPVPNDKFDEARKLFKR
jgi:hypothetical protein